MKKDFFISYTSADRQWAEWIAWQLEDAGYSVIIQAWDFRPGGNFVLDMHKAAEAKRTVAVLSPDYLRKPFPQSEWAAAFAGDPTSEAHKLLPVRIFECSPAGLLAQIVYIDLVGKEEVEAKEALLNGVGDRRNKPNTRPGFPGIRREEQEERSVSVKPHFPRHSIKPIHLLYISLSDPETKWRFLRSLLLLLRRLVGRPAVDAESLLKVAREFLEKRRGETSCSAVCGAQGNGIIVGIGGNPEEFLPLTLSLIEELKKRRLGYLRTGLHCHLAPTEIELKQISDLPDDAVNTARCVSEMGRRSQILASREAKELLEKDPKFAALFHSVGYRYTPSVGQIQLYNLYDKTIGDDKNLVESVLLRKRIPRALREMKEEQVTLLFGPAMDYALVRFEVGALEGSKVNFGITGRNLEIDAGDSGVINSGQIGSDVQPFETVASFKYDFAAKKESHKQTFKIIAQNITSDTFGYLRITFYNQRNERIHATEPHEIRLLHRPDLPASVTESLKLIPYIWDLLMRRAWYTRCLILILALLAGITVAAVKMGVKAPSQLKETFLTSVHYWPMRYIGNLPAPMDKFDMPSEWKIDRNPKTILVRGDKIGILKLPGDSEALYDFSFTFQIAVADRQSPICWALRISEDKEDYYLFKLTFPSTGQGAANLEGITYKNGVKQGNLKLKADQLAEHYTRTIQTGSTLFVIIEAHGNKLKHDFNIALADNATDDFYGQYEGRRVNVTFEDDNYTHKYGSVGFQSPAPDSTLRIPDIIIIGKTDEFK